MRNGILAAVVGSLLAVGVVIGVTETADGAISPTGRFTSTPVTPYETISVPKLPRPTRP
jgi:hypothetical protein